MNAFREEVERGKLIGAIGLTFTSASLISISVIMPAPMELRALAGMASVATGAIAATFQKERRSWREVGNYLTLSKNALLFSSCVSLVCAATIPSKPQWRFLNLFTLASGGIAIASAKKTAIVASSLSGLIDEEISLGFSEVFDSVVKPQSLPAPSPAPQLPPAPKPSPSPQQAQQQTQQPAIVRSEPSPQAVETVEVEVCEAPALEPEPELRSEALLTLPNIEDSKIEMLGAEVLAALAEYKFTQARWLGAISSPTFIRCLIDPGSGVSLAAIKKIAPDLGRILHLQNPLFPESPAIPVIGQQPGAISIDIPRPDRQIVYFSQYFSPKPVYENLPGLKLAIGVNLAGKLIDVDLSHPNTPHVLTGGTTGSGKSETLRMMLASGIWRYPPEQLQITIIDVKQVTFLDFENTPHVKAVIKSTEEAIPILQEKVGEMDKRYKLFAESGVKDLQEYCQKTGKVLPRMIVAIDEFADFMADKKLKAEIEAFIKRLGAVARAAGIHLIVGTQRPEKDVVTPAIRSNLPAIIGLKVGRDKDSPIIFGVDGYFDAYCLLGQGDLIYNQGFQRLQSPYFDLSNYLVASKVAQPKSTSPIDKHFSDRVEFVANRQERFEKLRLLPAHPGVYLVSDGTTPYYVGESENIMRRWTRSDKKHHWLPAIFELLHQGKRLFIYYKVATENRQKLESELIKTLQPKWNGKNPIVEVREMQKRQPACEPVCDRANANKTETPQIEGISETEISQVLQYKKEGLNQDAIIKKVWGVSKSGTDPKYIACRSKYQAISQNN